MPHPFDQREQSGLGFETVWPLSDPGKRRQTDSCFTSGRTVMAFRCIYPKSIGDLSEPLGLATVDGSGTVPRLAYAAASWCTTAASCLAERRNEKYLWPP